MTRWYRVAVYSFMLLVSGTIGAIAVSLAYEGPSHSWVFWVAGSLAGMVVGMALWGLCREYMRQD